MTRETYLKMTKPFRGKPERERSLHILNQILTGIVFIAYPALLAWLFSRYPQGLTKAICIPLDGFVGVTVFRYLINRSRPYEKFNVSPVIPKKTKGKSFPSRHVFCACIIAFSYFAVPGGMPIAVMLTICAFALAVIRVIAGVHYMSDVVAAIIIAVACAAFYWMV